MPQHDLYSAEHCIFFHGSKQRSHNATHCNTHNALQHTATHRNTLQHIATPCNTLQRDLYIAAQCILFHCRKQRSRIKQPSQPHTFGACTNPFRKLVVALHENRNPLAQRRDIPRDLVHMCCSVLQCVAVCCSVLQHENRNPITRRRDVPRNLVKICCSVLQHAATRCNTLQHTATHCNTLQHTFVEG